MALLLVLGVVLSANGGRNLIALFKALDIPLLQSVTRPPASASSEKQTFPGRRWPWLVGIQALPQPRASMSSPASMCAAFTVDGQEAPSFTKIGEDGWECSMLFAPSNDPAASSLFLQVRGKGDAQFTVVRVKFNLADGRLTTELVQRSLIFLRAAMTLPLSEELDRDLGEKLANQTDFYFLAGYHALIFRREMDDQSKYNLIGFNREMVGAERVTRWPKIGLLEAPQAMGPVKGPRLPAQSAGIP